MLPGTIQDAVKRGGGDKSRHYRPPGVSSLDPASCHPLFSAWEQSQTEQRSGASTARTLTGSCLMEFRLKKAPI